MTQVPSPQSDTSNAGSSPQLSDGKEILDGAIQGADVRLTSNQLLTDRSSSQFKDSRRSSESLNPLEHPESTKPSLRRREKRGWSLTAKSVAWAIALCMLPILTLGAITYLSNWTIAQQLSQAKQTGRDAIAEAEQALEQQRLYLLIGCGVTAAITGTIAAFLIGRTIRPILKAASISNTLVNRLRREEISTLARVAGKDERVALETNIGLIAEQLPRLLWKQEAESERSQLLTDITHRLWASFSEEDVFRTAVTEIRKAFRTDRVTIFRFDSPSDGTFVEESVAAGFPKLLWTSLRDPCFEEGYIERYRNGRIRAIDNIYQAGLSDCHIGMLERFAVKANLVAPLIKDNRLFGLLIAHQCSSPRFWQQSEVDLFAQIATQVGFALDHAKLLEHLDTKADRAQVFIEITRCIRESLVEEDILKTTVKEVRKEIGTDRVIVYGFDNNWYGTVVAESVVPGFPKALRAKIKDPCFAEGYVEEYRAGRVQATNNIYEAGLTACHISQLERFDVKANLVAPILKDGKLFGLLIAHHCSGPRNWQQSEIDLFAQIAAQVGYALDHARLLEQVDQAYQRAEAIADELRQQKEVLQLQILELLENAKPAIENLSTEAFSQIESIATVQNQIQAVANLAQTTIASVQQTERHKQQLGQVVQVGYEKVNQIRDSISTIRTMVATIAEIVKRLDQPSQKLLEVVDLASNVTAQIKLQAMNAALEAARSGDANQKFASIAQKVFALAQQFDTDITEIKPIVAEIQAETQEAWTVIGAGAEQTIAGTQFVEEVQQKFHQILKLNAQASSLAKNIAQTADDQTQTLASVNETILEVANTASQTSDQFAKVTQFFNQLATIIQKL